MPLRELYSHPHCDLKDQLLYGVTGVIGYFRNKRTYTVTYGHDDVIGPALFVFLRKL